MFIRTNAGQVNLAHVSRVTTTTTHSGKEQHTIYGTDGRSIGVVTDPDFDPNTLTAPVVPAAPGTTIVVINDPDTRGDQRPTDGDLWAEEIPVLAWRCTPYGAEPIVAWQESLGGCTVFNRMPDGSLNIPCDRTYPDILAAVAGMLRDAQDAWDRRHPAARAGAAQ